MFFSYYVKSGVENESEIRFVQFDLFWEKIGIFNWNSISGKNNSESRDVSGGTKILRNTYSLVELVW